MRLFRRRHPEVDLTICGKHPAWADFACAPSVRSASLAQAASRLLHEWLKPAVEQGVPITTGENPTMTFAAREQRRTFIGYVSRSRDAVGRTNYPLISLVLARRLPTNALFFQILPEVRRQHELLMELTNAGDVSVFIDEARKGLRRYVKNYGNAGQPVMASVAWREHRTLVENGLYQLYQRFPRWLDPNAASAPEHFRLPAITTRQDETLAFWWEQSTALIHPDRSLLITFPGKVRDPFVAVDWESLKQLRQVVPTAETRRTFESMPITSFEFKDAMSRLRENYDNGEPLRPLQLRPSLAKTAYWDL